MTDNNNEVVGLNVRYSDYAALQERVRKLEEALLEICEWTHHQMCGKNETKTGDCYVDIARTALEE